MPNFGPGTDPGVLRSWAQTVEGLGFDLLIVPYRHPLLIARMAANLNQLSDGRLVLGMGVAARPATRPSDRCSPARMASCSPKTTTPSSVTATSPRTPS